MEWTIRRMRIAFAALLVIAGVSLYGIGQAGDRSKNSVKAPDQNRRKFSEVFVLLDRSPSMSPWAFTDAKQIVRDKIIPSIGVNDRIVCYTLGAQFDDSQNLLFGKTSRDQPRSFDNAEAQRALSLFSQDAKPDRPRVFSDEELSFFAGLASKRQEVEAKQREWQAAVDALELSRIPSSNYQAALNGIKQQLKKNTQQRDTWLFVVGDLINASTTPDPVPVDANAFKDVKVVLIYPYQSNVDWQTIKKFWKGYFGENFEERTFATALRDQFLVPPNPTFGIETKAGENQLTLMRPFLIADVVILLLCIILFFVFGGRSRRVETPGAQSVENNPTAT